MILKKYLQTLKYECYNQTNKELFMIKRTVKDNGKIEYSLVQGDSFRLGVNTNTSEQVVDKIVFNVMDSQYNILKSVPYQQLEDDLWVVWYTTEITSEFEVRSDYLTEIEVTYVDGGVDTIEQAKLKVTEQGKE